MSDGDSSHDNGRTSLDPCNRFQPLFSTIPKPIHYPSPPPRDSIIRLYESFTPPSSSSSRQPRSIPPPPIPPYSPKRKRSLLTLTMEPDHIIEGGRLGKMAIQPDSD